MRATFPQAQEALSDHVDSVLTQIPVEQVQLCLPIDGKGVRIKASVPPEHVERVPSKVVVTLKTGVVEIPVEASDDYEPVEAL